VSLHYICLMAKDKLLNITELAKEIERTRTTIWRWVKAGLLDPVVMGRVKVYSLKKAIKVKQEKS